MTPGRPAPKKTASVSSGYAIVAVLVPTAESSCPVWNSMKSRLRRSGVSGSAIGRSMPSIVEGGEP
jgi:hypothetical protein